MRYDVIVVGAGPAGSTAARECASRGLSVLLLDKAAFPRDKPCGGGVNVRAARLLPFDLAPVIERVAFGVRFSLRQAGRFTRHSREPLTYLTQRSRLDAFLVERAVAAGAVLHERAAIRDVERHPAHVVVRAGTAAHWGRALVIADGVWGPTARLAGLATPRRMGIALEANVTPSGGLSREWTDVVGLDIGDPPGGYGWIFPRGDHVNLGVGGWRDVAPDLRTSLIRLARFSGFDPAGLWGVRGYHLPVRKTGAPLVSGNILLVGDAAGLLDPLTGEGIHAAIWSGRAAGAHLAAYLAGSAPDLLGYAREVEGALAPDLRVAHRLHDLIHHAPAIFVGSIRFVPAAWRLTCRVLRGDQTYAGAARRFRWAARFIPRGSAAVPRYARSSRGRISRPAITSHNPL